MNGDVSLDIGSLLPYVEQRLLSLFNRDEVSKEWDRRLKDLARLSLEHASYVQSVGMHTPVPIRRIYQPTQLHRRSAQIPNSQNVRDVIRREEDAIIFAGPGRGKTTLLHHLYVSLANDHAVVPILFTLRWANVPKDLAEFVEHLSKKSSSKQKILLLVDGYDEISSDDKEIVSRALLVFKSHKLGQYILTCRSFYPVYDLKATNYELSAFSREDAVRFVDAFSETYGAKIEAEALVAELALRGFGDFLSHPLMLTLVCVLRTGPNAEIPRRAIGLIRRALETLTFRWDEAKRVSRSSLVPLDGEERVRSLMRIAYEVENLKASQEEVERAVRKHLQLIQMSKVNPTKLIEELAQWYGILIPIDDVHWEFVHRTIHDYLAARYWVESGLFASNPIPVWNSRAAYAICLLPDGTDMIVRMLSESEHIAAFSECLYNRAPFDVKRVGEAVVARAHRRGRARLANTAAGVAAQADEDFYREAGPEFLRALVEIGSGSALSDSGTVVACYALSELKRRGIRTSQQTLRGRLGELYRSRRLASIDVSEHADFSLAEVISQ